MCGIIGIVGKSPVNQGLYDGLTVLQHRGQDAAGIMTSDGDRLHLRKDNGLVRDVFHTRHMLRLKGNMGIGHVRYPTAGCSSSAESQPFYVNSPYGISLAHNGNLTNADTLKGDMFREDLRHINTNSDSEILLNVFAHELQRQGKLRIDEGDVFEAVTRVHKRVRGAYAAVAMIIGYGIVAFRDKHGIRPLAIGRRETPQGTEWTVASETVAVDALGFERVRDLEPGEAVFIDVDGNFHSRQCAEGSVYSPCIFEYVYFARPDSIIDGISVYKARLRMGERLARKILREWPQHDIDVVIPIPDTSRTSALQLSYELGVLYREGFIKNRYIGRTFIMPGQKQRKKSVRQKLNAIGLEFRGKNVLLVDDSIVRGTTSKQIIQMARDAGANKVYFASAAPPVRYPNVYGIDMPTTAELIGHGRDDKQIAEAIGADWLIYQDLDDLISAVLYKDNKKVRQFDTSVFSGEYPTGDVTPEYLKQLEQCRSDGAKETRDLEEGVTIDLHNSE
ncbi:amidophosphoribosyltransferase [Thiohalomonas denitrificans]|uniref:Amidophosphoribosyltransferase n=1 Tax=Thiohalomonas denitrificans TaxID=415747 RepID=A0A1G5QRK2_9GAMM|nr:amidophosphoribosyltransferase [Thiohalomonas denitrificans]SCZ63729.1 amidophosphoribosyltransferase [Thiohalomonas denitrificans]